MGVTKEDWGNDSEQIVHREAVGTRQLGSPNLKFAGETNNSIAEFARKDYIKSFEKNFDNVSDEIRANITSAVPKIQDDGLL